MPQPCALMLSESSAMRLSCRDRSKRLDIEPVPRRLVNAQADAKKRRQVFRRLDFRARLDASAAHVKTPTCHGMPRSAPATKEAACPRCGESHLDEG